MGVPLGQWACVRTRHVDQLDASYLPSAMPSDRTESWQHQVGSFWSLRTDEEGQAQRRQGTCQRSRPESAAARPGLRGRRLQGPTRWKAPLRPHPGSRHPPTHSECYFRSCISVLPSPQVPEPPDSTRGHARGKAKAVLRRCLLARLQARGGESCREPPAEQNP